MGGANNTAMPNLSDMTSANNRHMKDVTDKETLNLRQARNLLEEFKLEFEKDEEVGYKAPPVISHDLTRLKNKLDEYFQTAGGKRRKRMLTENDINFDDLKSKSEEEPILEMKMTENEIFVEAFQKSDKSVDNDDIDLSNLED